MTLKIEIKRKALHMTGLTVPAVYLLFGKEVTVLFVSLALTVFLILEPFRTVEELRERIKKKLGIPEEIANKIEKEIESIAREHEKRGIGAHIYFAAASLIIVLLFPREVAIGSIAVATLGDAVAAIVGKSFGNHRFKNGKSIEGSLSHFIVGLLILFPLVGFKIAIIGAFVGTLAEFYEVPPDDNFSSQLIIAITLYLLGVR
ncbi:phosphatidate cytidylyltransferase [Pyrococcus furiosus DSM 3638]|uniref:Phosphatidate cytidylyltransferase n=3 Tax=Pyrococcus furiosus TaxID=2261 RepID=Q8U1P5_PYRFU|nr:MULTISPECIES: diacylglycerol/polyprenol kinase family protein [Pyrococcus]AAL81284.1 hypothetical protein PF1160 [Pyrococcus furiosus DSM 3638]AFN03952.1 hypothetical protein PFC_05025 [Pyrococcus furiosus COM1]MDK2869317.1 hypothetical protein [Pyrococcus sp.]QEK78814.1 phosphatidate cytidylyltransferase [Pyrococcus furiosus DSM 3638]